MRRNTYAVTKIALNWKPDGKKATRSSSKNMNGCFRESDIEQCFLTWVPRRSLEGSAKVMCCVFIKILKIEKS
jgi:hypothetical protein